MKIQYIAKKVTRKLSWQRSRINQSARMFIPAIGKKIIVVPFTTLSVIPVIILVGVSGYLLFRSDIFLVKHVSIDIDGGIPGDALYAESIAPKNDIENEVQDVTIARSLWSINKQEIIDSIEQTNPSVEQVTVSTHLPDTVNVLVQERHAVAQVTIERKEQTPDGKELAKNEYYLVDQQGKVYLQLSRKVNLPEFFYPAAVENLVQSDTIIGYQFPGDVVDAIVTITNRLSQNDRLQLTKLIVEDATTIRIETTKGLVIIMGIQQDLNEQLRRLEVVYEQIVYSGRDAILIDTRFDKTVVQYK